MDESLYDLLLDQGLTEEQIEEILSLGEAGTERDILARQTEFAEGLQDTPTPRGRGWGRVYRASHPMEHIGTLAQRMAGGYRTGQIEEEKRNLAGQQTSARSALLRALGRGRAPVATPGSLGPAQSATTTPLEPMALTTRSRWTPYNMS